MKYYPCYRTHLPERFLIDICQRRIEQLAAGYLALFFAAKVLVIIWITPPTASDPYIAEEAPFKTSILEISAGAIGI